MPLILSESRRFACGLNKYFEKITGLIVYNFCRLLVLYFCFKIISIYNSYTFEASTWFASQSYSLWIERYFYVNLYLNSSFWYVNNVI